MFSVSVRGYCTYYLRFSVPLAHWHRVLRIMNIPVSPLVPLSHHALEPDCLSSPFEATFCVPSPTPLRVRLLSIRLSRTTSRDVQAYQLRC